MGQGTATYGCVSPLCMRLQCVMSSWPQLYEQFLPNGQSVDLEFLEEIPV
jgi:hypothetical protein